MNHLYVCSICQVEIEALAKRRRVEIDTFIKVRAAGGGAAGPGFQPLPGTPGLEDERAAWPQAPFGGCVLWAVGVATGRCGHRSGQMVKVSLTGAVGLGESSSTHWPY